MQMCVFVCVRAHTHTHANANIHACSHACAHACTHTYWCTYLCCTQIHILWAYVPYISYAHTYYMHTYAYKHLYRCMVCIHLHIFMYMNYISSHFWYIYIYIYINLYASMHTSMYTCMSMYENLYVNMLKCLHSPGLSTKKKSTHLQRLGSPSVVTFSPNRGAHMHTKPSWALRTFCTRPLSTQKCTHILKSPCFTYHVRDRPRTGSWHALL